MAVLTETLVATRYGVRWAVAGPIMIAVVSYIYGARLVLIDEQAFLHWVREDGLVEWLTFAALIASAGWAFNVARARRGRGSTRTPVSVWYAIAFLSMFAALEEISYGQRIIGIPTPEFLLPASPPETDFLYNRQSETTLHNLMIGGLNVNKVVFGQLLGVLTAIHVLVLPAIYRSHCRVGQWIDRWGIPVARIYQSAVFLAVAVANSMLRAGGAPGKVSEMQELVGCTMFLILILHPSNGILPCDSD